MGVPVLAVTVAIIVFGIGIGGGYHRVFWVRGAGAVLVALLMFYLAAMNGSLAEPAKDGLLTRWVRDASDDGSLVTIVSTAVMVVGYVAIAWLIWTGMRKGRERAEG